MFEPDADDSEEDDFSDVDEGIQEEIADALRTLGEYPTPCPVCSPCKYTFRLFKNRTALRQHASAMVTDRSAHFVKVRAYHEELVMRIDSFKQDTHDPMEIDEDGNEYVSRTDLGKAAAAAIEFEIEKDDYLRKRQRKNTTLKAEIIKKRRQIKRANDRLEDAKNQLVAYRNLSENHTECVMKEIEMYEEELVRKQAENSQMLTAQSAKVEQLRREIHLQNPQENIDAIYAELRRNRDACSRLQKTKDELQGELTKQRKKKTQAEATIAEARLCASKMERKAKELHEEGKKGSEVKDYEVTFELLGTLGIKILKLPIACIRCQRKFQTSKTEKTHGVCQRIIMEVCNCADHCSDCLKKLNFCPRHHRRVGEGIRFRMYG